MQVLSAYEADRLKYSRIEDSWAYKYVGISKLKVVMRDVLCLIGKGLSREKDDCQCFLEPLITNYEHN